MVPRAHFLRCPGRPKRLTGALTLNSGDPVTFSSFSQLAFPSVDVDPTGVNEALLGNGRFANSSLRWFRHFDLGDLTCPVKFRTFGVAVPNAPSKKIDVGIAVRAPAIDETASAIPTAAVATPKPFLALMDPPIG